MNIWEIDKLQLFLTYFIPGFISLKVYELLIPSDSKDFSKSLYEVIGYSTLNFAAFFWVVYLLPKNFSTNHPTWYVAFQFLVIFITPILWPVLFINLSSHKWLSKYFRNPAPTPWDFVFMADKAFWVIVHLKDGTKVGGIYSNQSAASSYPSTEQVFLEEVWNLDEDGKFLAQAERGCGILILSDIKFIEFFE